MTSRHSRRASRTLLAIFLIAALLVPATITASAPARGGPNLYLVEVDAAQAPPAFRGSDARLVSWDAESGIALVETTDASALRRHSGVLSVEPDGRVRAAASTWDSASWDRASWDRASWDRASWDRASWDRASWDRASWDRASWDTEEWTPERLATWGLSAIGAPQAWAVGAPAHTRNVCLVDSGIDATHPLLAPNLWRSSTGAAGIDLVRGDDVPDDEGGHGTHLAGIVGAAADASGFRGVAAPLLMSAKVLDGDGAGRTSDVIAGIAWCRENDAHVIALALTEDAPTRALAAAVRAAAAKGILLVGSAGNQGPCDRCVSYPAAYPHVMAVAAFMPDGFTPAFSATGREVAIAAPGVAILSTYPGDAMRYGSGTSQSVAYAAGAAALLWAQNPGWSARQVEHTLLTAATDAAGPGRDAFSGHGYLDVGAASRSAR